VSGDRTNLLGLARTELEAFVAERLGAKPFRARQLMKWIYRRGAADFAVMSDLAQDFRAQLSEVAQISVPRIVAQQLSNDGTRKFISPSRTAARCAFPARSAAPWTARFARPRNKDSTAT